MKKSLFLYPLILALFALGLYWLLEHGRGLEAGPTASAAGQPAPAVPATTPGLEPAVSLLAYLPQHYNDPLTRLLGQLILVVLVTRLCGGLARKVAQPAVIGEIVAGILLGPSLLGWLWSGAFNFMFPAASLGTLRMLSQIGVCLFMFVVGMELDMAELKRQAHTAVMVGKVSILFPFLLGVAAALLLFPALGVPHTRFVAFALFLGISMSITAFPVLARILEDRGLTKTALGSMALGCAATNDVLAWSALAVVVAIVKAGGLASAFTSVGLVVVFIAIMMLWVKPGLPRWIGRPGLTPGKGLMAGVLVFLFASALVADVIGIHALFGAFLAGVVIPRHGEFRETLRERLEHFSSVFLLPLFFAFTGLRTQIGLLSEPSDWLICGGLIALATIGKLGGATLAARLTGINWLDAFALGALMNSRGLIELVALNIGYDLGILSPPMFTMLVIMALVTTCLTGPLLSLSEALRLRKAPAVSAV